MPKPLPDASRSILPCKNTAKIIEGFIIVNFIFKLNRLEANPSLIIKFLGLAQYDILKPIQ